MPKHKRLCNVCGAPHYTGGYCQIHYNRMKYTGTTDPRPTYKTRATKCKVEGCEKQAVSMLMCKYHYNKQRKDKLKCEVPIETTTDDHVILRGDV